MRLKVAENIFEFTNDSSSIDLIVNKINQELSESTLFFSHLIINGQEIFEDFENYLLDNINLINDIEVILFTVEEFVNNLLLSLEDYINRALPEIEVLINNFYQGPTKDNWQNFELMIDGIQWIIQTIETISESVYHPSNWDEYSTSMQILYREIKQLEQAIESYDNVLIADILQYEINPALKEIKNQCTKAIDHEGKRYNVN